MTPAEWAILFIHAVVAPWAAIHALLSKREPRAALGWIGICVIFPMVGPFLYFLFGINRVRTHARRLQGRPVRRLLIDYGRPGQVPASEEVPQLPAEYNQLREVSDSVSKRALTPGNGIEMLENGEQAFPAMLAAIRSATDSIFLMTYILETNRSGREFIEALALARKRGVQVCVLLDGLGEMYSWPRASRLLAKSDVPVSRFLPPRLLPPKLNVNLRNHRKILVVDGATGFTGGMNIGDRQLLDDPANRHPTRDLHFRLRGPVVAQLQQLFLESWRFSTGENVRLPQREAKEEGTAMCRTIADGPDEDLDRIQMVLLGAITAARSSVRIITPYFLPTRDLIAALQAAALKGVEVSVILPEKNNLPYVHWATRNMLWELLHWKVRIYYQPPPFAHTKLFIVDENYVQIGSANLDARSLRLNFELAVEIYDRAFADRVTGYFEAIRRIARPVHLDEVEKRTIPVRLRDSFCWLFSPYL